jgi:hypothetical protein
MNTKCFLLQKVRYRIKGRGLFFAVLVCQREGLSLLYVRRPDGQGSDLVVAIEGNGFYDDAPGSRFPLEKDDLETIGSTLLALGSDECQAMRRRMFEPDDEDLL